MSKLYRLKPLTVNGKPLRKLMRADTELYIDGPGGYIIRRDRRRGYSWVSRWDEYYDEGSEAAASYADAVAAIIAHREQRVEQLCDVVEGA